MNGFQKFGERLNSFVHAKLSGRKFALCKSNRKRYNWKGGAKSRTRLGFVSSFIPATRPLPGNPGHLSPPFVLGNLSPPRQCILAQMGNCHTLVLRVLGLCWPECHPEKVSLSSVLPNLSYDSCPGRVGKSCKFFPLFESSDALPRPDG